MWIPGTAPAFVIINISGKSLGYNSCLFFNNSTEQGYSLLVFNGAEMLFDNECCKQGFAYFAEFYGIPEWQINPVFTVFIMDNTSAVC